MDDSVQIRCTRCKSEFRDRAHRIQSGYSRQCPNCEAVIFFEEGSVDRNIQRALLVARRLRRALLDVEVEKRRAIALSDAPEETSADSPEQTKTRGAPTTNRSSYRRR